MTDPKGSESGQAGNAATEKKPAAKRAGTQKNATDKTAAEKTIAKTTGKKTTSTSAKAAPKTPAKTADSSAKAVKDANAKASKPAAKKTVAPRKKTESAEAASTASKAKVSTEKTEAAKKSSRKPAAAKAAPAEKAAPTAGAKAPEAAPVKAEAETTAAAKPRSRAPKKTAAPAAATEAPAAPAPVETKAPAASAETRTEAAPQKAAPKNAGRGRRPAAAKPVEHSVAPEAPAVEASASSGEAPSEGESGTGEERGERKRRGRSRRGRRKSKNPAGREPSGESSAASADDPIWAEAAADIDPVSAFNDMADDEEEDEEDDRASGRGERKPEPPKKLPRRKMFVCVQPDEQVEVVITEEGLVQEYYVEMLHQAKTKGNIYKAAISNVDANLQAAFVGYGAVKNGFLQIDEVHPEYYVASHEAGKGRKYPPIQKVLKPGQEVLVQVVKEPTGTKGAFLTTYLSLAGRFLVLTPGREQIGVSRKVENEAERARLREMLNGLTPGPGLGVIVRTVSMGVDKSHLEADLEQLKKRWAEVRDRGTSAPSPTLIHQEMDLVARAVRDYLTDQVVEVWVDDDKTAKAVADVAAGLFPRKTGLVRVHGKDQNQTLFERFNIQRQVEQIHSREVTLPSGGRLVIDPTEALTAIDINSGRSGGKNNFEDMAYRTNLEAARMIPLQLRLRDIGGQIVVDFIEMRDKNHWREVEKAVRQGMKVDRARYDVGKMGPFGMLEIVRQRLGSSAISVSTEPCPHCKGTGVRRNMEWQSQQALREIQALMQAAQAGEIHAKDGKDAAKDAPKDASARDAKDAKDVKNGKEHTDSVIYEAEPDLAMHLLNQKRRRIAELEQIYNLTLEIRFKHPAG